MASAGTSATPSSGSSKAAAFDKAGYLSKQGENRKGWKKRYMTLKGGTLLYYANPKDAAPKGTIRMEGYDVRPVDANRIKKKLCFEIFHVERKTFYMCADTVEEMEEWMSALLASTVTMNWGSVLPPVDPALKGTQKPRSAEKELKEATCIESMRLPRIKEAPQWQRKAVLKRKMLLCSVCFSFNDHTENAEAKEIKRQTLLELVDYCDSVRGAFNDPSTFMSVMKLVSCNIFRTLCAPDERAGEEDDEDAPFMEPAWPHISIVYEFLLHLVQASDVELAYKKKFIDSKFVTNLLTLFDSQDMRERDYLKTITHRIYGKLTNRRALIRRTISNMFYEFIYETERHNGVAEMLEILGSIINGFAVPVKEEHTELLVRALIPLHKVKTVAAYHQQLAYCMAQYVSKDDKFAVQIITGLLRFWPFGNSTKEVLFLNELEEVLEYVTPATVSCLEVALFNRIGRCISGMHFHVAERALCLWNNPAIVSLAVEDPEHRKIIFPILFPHLYSNSTQHWHSSVKALAQTVLTLFMEADGTLYAACLEQELARRDAAGL